MRSVMVPIQAFPRQLHGVVGRHWIGLRGAVARENREVEG